MKMLYIACQPKAGAPDPGVQKKIRAQAKAYTELGIETRIQLYPLLPKYIRALPFSTNSVDWDHITVPGDVDAIYIRYAWADLPFLRFLARTRREHPQLKILIGIPTYPYEGEKRSRIIAGRDLRYRDRMKRYIDRIVVLSDHGATLFGVPTLTTLNGNGIDVSSIPCRTPHKAGDGGVDLLCVANFQYWHGIDRLLEGMSAYYQNGGERPVRLHLAGTGSDIAHLKSMADTDLLRERVRFYGYVDGDPLTDLYNACDIGVGSLGDHRKGGPGRITSALKSREYLARGMPFICSSQVDVFKKYPADFGLQVPENDTPIDIAALLRFYDGLLARESEADLIRRIRAYAEAHVDMRDTVRPVAAYLLGTQTG